MLGQRRPTRKQHLPERWSEEVTKVFTTKVTNIIIPKSQISLVSLGPLKGTGSPDEELTKVEQVKSARKG